jgi:hypothetical protein
MSGQWARRASIASSSARTATHARAAVGRRRYASNAAITDKHERQPFYYSRWFNCTHADCKTTLVMPERYKVFTDAGKQQLAEREHRLAVAEAAADVVMQVARETVDEDTGAPW